MTDQRAISAIRLRTALALALLLAACSPVATPSTSSTPSPSTTQSPSNAPVTTARTTTTSGPIPDLSGGTRGYSPGEYWWDPGFEVWMHNPVGNSIGVELSIAPWGGNKDEPGPMSAVIAGYEGTYRQLPVSAEGVRTEVWVVDIEGTAMTITVTAQPEVTDAELAEAHAVVESIRSEPWENEAGFRMLLTLPPGWDSG